MKAFLIATGLLVAAATAWAATQTTINVPITITHGGQAILSIVLSNASTTTGLPSGTAVGTFSVTMNPALPVFSYIDTNLHLSATGADSGGKCSAANSTGNGSFQVGIPTALLVTDGQPLLVTDTPSPVPFQVGNIDTLATNGAVAAGTYAICVAAAEPGVNPAGQAFTITVGHLIDAATLSNCSGHDGSSGNPWPDSCVQQAVGLAVSGDTVLLRAGNWAMSTDSGVTVQIAKSIKLIGQGSGNTFDPYGHPTNIKGVPTGSFTRVYTTGTQYNGPANPNTAHYSGYIQFGQDALNRGTPCPANMSATISHIFFDGSQSTDGGDYFGTINARSCSGLTFDDILVNVWRCADQNGAGCAIPTDLGIPETQAFVFLGSNNTIVKNSVFAIPLNSLHLGAYHGAQTYQTQELSTELITNNIFWEYYANPFRIDNLTFSGNVSYQYNDGVGDSIGLKSFGTAGCGPPTGNCAYLNAPNGGTSTPNDFAYNNLFWSAGDNFGMGGGVNDGGNGTEINAQFKGNWVVASNGSLATCEWHIFGGFCDSGVAGSSGMQMNGLIFQNNSLKVTTSAILDLTGAGIAGDGNTLSLGNMTCSGCLASANWASTPASSNRALLDGNSVNGTKITNNFGWDVTSGFTAAPTVSFTLGPLGLNGVVAILNPTFTAQYGAVQWIASTSPTTPTPADARWSSNNSGFPAPQASVTYVPPVSLSGANHGDTVYVWVMDSANHISAAASAFIP